MNPATTIGRYVLSTRFTANVRIAYIDYPSDVDLEVIYSAYYQAILQNPNY